MSPSSDTPLIPEDLLTSLEALFPDRCPSPGTAIDEVWAAAGRAQVIRYLRSEFEHQKREALSDIIEQATTPQNVPT